MVRVVHVRLALLLLFVASGAAADKNGALSGRVVDVTGAPVRPARICLLRSDFGRLCENYTDAEGQFHIEELQPGIYQVTITLQGFLEKTVPEVQIASSQNVNLGVLHLDFAPCNTPGGPICDEVQAIKRRKSIHTRADIPIVRVCEALSDPSRFDGATIIVVGRSSATDEGSWLDEDCAFKLVIEGRDWPTSISTAYVRSEFAPPPQMPKGFKWDKRLLQQKLDQVKKTTQLQYKNHWLALYGRLETQRSREAGLDDGRTLSQQPGYGHLNSSPAQLIAAEHGFLKLR